MIKKSIKKFLQSNLRNFSLFISLIFLLIVVGFVTKANAANVHALPLVVKSHIPVCPGAASVGNANCHARVVSDKSGRPMATLSPTGFGPVQFSTAYNLPATASGGMPIIAIVDAYDNPNAFSDLNFYSAYYGIPQLPQCAGSILSSSVPCFKKINQNGGTTYPNVNSGWALEISLDIQVAHAICQNCKILLVEASSNSYANLMTGVNQAVTQGASVISNSYGSNEFAGESSYDAYLNHPGIAITFSSGDSGYGSSYPAASPYVTAVGGTTLFINSDNSYNHESVWNGAGSGCSLLESKPSFQKDSGCAGRTIADVSAVADPSSGASVYDTVSYNGQSGWFQVGGTSLSAPLIGAVYALAGVKPGVAANSVLYANFAGLRDITSGNNGTCNPSYLCTGLVGFDGPTGLGSPNGLVGFGGESAATPTPTLTLTPTPTPDPDATPTPTLAPTLTPTPTITPVPVSVVITNPTNGGTVLKGSFVTITTSVSSNVNKVNFTVNGVLKCSDVIAPFSCTWNVPFGFGKTYNITAAASSAGGSNASNSITVTSR